MCDADLFIHYSDLDKAKKILLTMGYREEINKNVKHCCFYHHNNLEIELHWVLIDPGDKIHSVSLEENIWQNAIPAHVGKEFVLSLSTEDEIVFLLLHIAEHFKQNGFGLRMLCDLILLIEARIDQINWNKIFQKAKECHIWTFMQVIFMTCENLFSLHIPNIKYSESIQNNDFYQEFLKDILTKERDRAMLLSEEIVTEQVLRKINQKTQKPYRNFHYMISFIFPPKQELYFGFTKNHTKQSLLYPIAWIHRLIRGIKKKNITIREKIGIVKNIGSLCQDRNKLLQWLNLI